MSDNYWEAPGYDGGKLDHQNLQCATEVFIKPVINPLGVDLNVPIYTLIDRIDVNEGIVVVDYKTGGKGDPNPYLLGEHGYLPQMIFYKWAVEAEYGEKVRKVLLSVPGAYTLSLRWVDMNVGSLVEQSKVVEQVYRHLYHAKKCKETRVYETTIMRYCNSCPVKNQCFTYIKEKGLDVKAPESIEIFVNVEDKMYNPDSEK